MRLYAAIPDPSTMEPACKFLQEYLPSEEAEDPVLALHLENCDVCPGEVTRVDSGTAFEAEA